MTFRLVLAVLLLLLSLQAKAADCIVVDQQVMYFSGYYSPEGASITVRDEAKDACGELTIVERRRQDPRPSVRVLATYAEFATPRSAAEFRYNEWVRERASKVPLSGSFAEPPAPSGHDEHMFASNSLYRSARLLSASISNTICCRWPPSPPEIEALTLDAESGQPILPRDLVHLGAVANHCWEQFSRLERFWPSEDVTGKRFAVLFPRQQPFADQDFASDAGVKGPADRLLAAVLKTSDRWVFSEKGLTIAFGAMLGTRYPDFNCQIDPADLQTMALPGVSVPP